jgi:hypothetical protein
MNVFEKLSGIQEEKTEKRRENGGDKWAIGSKKGAPEEKKEAPPA